LTSNPSTAILRYPIGEVSSVIIAVGDPSRARRAAAMLEDMRPLSDTRGYPAFTGRWKGVPVSIASHGMGAGGASICFEELIQAGAKTIIRAGTCGSLQPEYREGNLIIVTGAVRSDGASQELIPPTYPALAHYEVTTALVAAAKNAAAPGQPTGVGVCISGSVFYPGVLASDLGMWAKARVLAVEMEVAVLLTIAGLRGIRAGALLTVDNYVFERTEYEPYRDVVQNGVSRMLTVTFDAAVDLGKS
jgi:uridine phosphorylase